MSLSALVAIPTLTRADLLARNREFLESLRPPDKALIIDNGGQCIGIGVEIFRPDTNLGVGGSWNATLRTAFQDGSYDLAVILQDDIIWDCERLLTAKTLAASWPDVDLFLSHLEFSVQVHRRTNIEHIGFYDDRYHPAWCEDDDYGLTMTSKGRIYQRFEALDPLPGSITCGTTKPVDWNTQHGKLLVKWPQCPGFGINLKDKKYFVSNRGLTLAEIARV